MDKSILLGFINEGYSTYGISKEVGKSQTTVRYWLKKYNLKTNLPFCRGGNKKKWFKKEIVCTKCKEEKNLKNFYPKRRAGYHTYCKECLTKIAKDRQQKLKIKCVEYKGGKCCNCGYNKYFGALEFHHINPKEKDFSISKSIRTFNSKLKIELDKCLLVCSNCHREIHGGVININDLLQKINNQIKC